MPKKASQGWSDDATQSCSGDLHSEGMKKKEGPACILHEMCNGQGWSKAIERETCNDHCMQDGCNTVPADRMLVYNLLHSQSRLLVFSPVWHSQSRNIGQRQAWPREGVN